MGRTLPFLTPNIWPSPGALEICIRAFLRGFLIQFDPHYEIGLPHYMTQLEDWILKELLMLIRMLIQILQ